MAAPSATPRQTPGGIFLPDGYQSLVTCAGDPDIEFFEIEITPVGYDFGEPINTTTQHNVLWRTMALRQLISLTPLTLRAAYDPVFQTSILAQARINQVFTQKWYDGSTLAFWGGFQNVQFGPLVEGTFPEVTITIVPTNRDNSGVEQAPVLVEVAGT